MTARVIGAADAAAGIADGATVVLSGSGGGLQECDHIYAAIERRFLATGHPRDLTVVHALGIGDGRARGMNRFAHEGLVRRVIGGHWSWSPRMQQLAADNRIEAYTLPAGVIMLLVREIGAGRPGLITHVGLGTFADPRLGGGACNSRTIEPLSELVTFDGKTRIRYKPFRIDVGILRASVADGGGNLSTLHEAADIDALSVAMGAHNSGGRVIAQVRATAPRGSLPARQVAVPGIYIDDIVVAADEPQSYLGGYDPVLAGEIPPIRRGAESPPAMPRGIRAVIAARAADEIRAGASVNFGYGLPGGIPAILAGRGQLGTIWVSVEQGIHNGELLDGDVFGAARYPEAIVSSTNQFDFYSGGGIDIAFLGMGELDGAGNVNVSRLGGKLIGPGGFVDISQNAKKVVFCGTFEAKGVACEITAGGLRVTQAGSVPKLVERVAEISFSGAFAREVGQEVLYVTERAVFRLEPQGVALIEVADGIDVEREVLARMGFRPLLPAPPRRMPAQHFAAFASSRAE